MEVLEKSQVLAYISPMQDIQRRLAPVLLDAARHFSAVVVTGPRRAEGGTTLLRRLFPKAQYVLREYPDLRAVRTAISAPVAVHEKEMR